MKTFAIATIAVVTAAFSFNSVAHAGGLQIPGNGYNLKPGFQMPKGPINIGKINPGVIKNPGLIIPVQPVNPPPAPPKGGLSNDEALALGLGIATVGIIAASASHSHAQAVAYDDGDCWYEKQLRYKKSGKAYIKKVLVCE